MSYQNPRAPATHQRNQRDYLTRSPRARRFRAECATCRVEDAGPLDAADALRFLRAHPEHRTWVRPLEARG